MCSSKFVENTPGHTRWCSSCDYESAGDAVCHPGVLAADLQKPCNDCVSRDGIIVRGDFPVGVSNTPAALKPTLAAFPVSEEPIPCYVGKEGQIKLTGSSEYDGRWEYVGWGLLSGAFVIETLVCCYYLVLGGT